MKLLQKKVSFAYPVFLSSPDRHINKSHALEEGFRHFPHRKNIKKKHLHNKPNTLNGLFSQQ